MHGLSCTQGLTVRWTRLGGDMGERLREAYGASAPFTL
jgi:hypothetical protein